MRKVAFLILPAIASLGSIAQARTAKDSIDGSGATIVASTSCVNTTVRSVEPRLTSGRPNEPYTRQEIIDSGPAVTFNTKIGQPTGVIWAEVVHYGNEPGNAVMIRERPGDRVRVCFLGGPKPDEACDPRTDLRGRTFSVYDYRQEASYAGMNGEHDCGGA
ncbi:MAG TPA: hypothetical protein VGF86_14145 [Candidatus Tumulicola sp.]